MNYTEYEFFPLECDLCKQRIDPYFEHKGIMYSLMENEETKPPYTILEAQSQTATELNCNKEFQKQSVAAQNRAST